MKVSEGLLSQIERLSKTGSFSVTMVHKKELQELIENIGANKYDNLNCGTCTRNAMHDLNRYLQQKKDKPVLQINKPVNMTMDKKPEEMSYQELKKACKARNIKAGRVGKIELIKLLNENK